MLINVITITFGPHSSPSNIATREKSQKYIMGYKRDSEDSEWNAKNNLKKVVLIFINN